MADFRRIVLALAVLTLFVGLAGAQTNQALQCNASVVPPQLRSEGVTELMGDIVLSCTGGAATALGQPIPYANFTVYTNTTVTSRLIGGSSVSEALLLIDEPGSGLGGYGTTVPITACQTPLTGCQEYVGTIGANVGVPVQALTGTGASLPGWNMFFGVVSGSSVTFNGVPVLAPVTTGTRVFRITNVRVNTSAITGGTLPGSVIADVAISGSTSVNVNNSALTTGYVAQSLKTSQRNSTDGGTLSQALLQCNNEYGSSTSQPVQYEYLRYTELFASAWKTRVNPSATNAAAGAGGLAGAAQSATAEQNIPGFIYTSETGFTPYIGTSPVLYTGSSATGAIPGLADYGTRVKAVFSNIPAGVSIYVATASSAGSGTTSVVLIPSATYLYGAGTLVGLTPTTTSVAGVSYNAAQLAIVNGSAQAVWEVITTSTSAVENVDIPVALLYVANPGSNSPAIGTATVNMEYAPVAADIGGTITSASSSQPIPRFIDTSTAATFFSTNLCTTTLLFPFVTNQSGFDTGLAIANTSTDPFGTTPQAGTCTLYWYGAAAPANTVTASVASGTDWAGLTSLLAPGFQGYMIATCNFEFAHGFAFISDLGARNLAMGYLALIMNGPSLVWRPTPTGENLEN